ncbi:MAG: hypothetical protein VX265_08945 [Myxococcota bacterium]|nr:hypothetical protein [Myxococcota bacterium]
MRVLGRSIDNGMRRVSRIHDPSKSSDGAIFDGGHPGDALPP